MGYTTDFSGEFKLNKPLDSELLVFLQKFNDTRRMCRDVAKLQALYKGQGGLPSVSPGVSYYGVQGEFFVDGTGMAGQYRDASVIDGNVPPETQPGLWCHWRPTDDGTAIEWDQGEKFYEYVAWLEYLIENILKPRGYSLTGDVLWRGESMDDIGVISVKDNAVKTYPGRLKAPRVRKTKPQVKPVENLVTFTTRFMYDGAFVEARGLAHAIRQAKDAGAGLDLIIEDLERIAAKG